MLSTHRVEVVPLALAKHENADTLSIATVYGFTCVTRTDQWAGVSQAAFIPPDNLVPIDRSEFAFLRPSDAKDGYIRIRAKKIRGVLSFGLLVPAPIGSSIGDDVTEALGVKHYDPETAKPSSNRVSIPSGEAAPDPDVYSVKYDLESGRRYAQQLMIPGERIISTEKLDGANARYCFARDRMHYGSRTEWKREYPVLFTAEQLVEQSGGRLTLDAARMIADKRAANPKRSMWWRASTPEAERFCRDHPGSVLYGEVYGAVQGLTYGHVNGNVSFAAFDVLDNGVWLDAERFLDMMASYGIPTAPVLYRGPYDFEHVCAIAEGQSTLANHVREGVVITPAVERCDTRLGRVKLKFVSAAYLERAK